MTTDAAAGSATCPWCGAPAGRELTACPSCGAPLKFKPKRDDSGWVELPPIKDMSRLRIGDSTCQIEGEYVPVADFNLAKGDGVYFAHHTLLWRDPSVDVRVMPMAGAAKRMFAGMPLVMTEALGPGHIAFSKDVPGELIAIPLQRGQSVHAHEHAFVAAMKQVTFDWVRSGAYYTTRHDKDQTTHYPIGQYLDEFTATEQHGLLLLHAGGNAFIRDLQPGEWLMVKPTAFLYKDPSVRLGMCMDTIQVMLGYQTILWLQLVGPGRICVQSAYPPMEAERESIIGTSGRVTGAWEHGFAASPTAAIHGPHGNRTRQLLAPAAVPANPAQTPAYPRTANDYRNALEKLIAEAMINGQVPPAAMEQIAGVASGHGLSAYDLQTLVNRVKSGHRPG